MALSKEQLFLAPSTIPAAGTGLFTTTAIPKGTRIIEYKGHICTWKQACEKDHTNPYLFYVKRSHVIDAQTYLKSLGRYINDAKGMSKTKGINNNCQFVVEGLQVFIDAIKNIPAASEIFVGYGKEYWDQMKTMYKK